MNAMAMCKKRLIIFVVALASCCVGNGYSPAIDAEIQQRSNAANNVRRNRMGLKRNVIHDKNDSRSLLFKQRRRIFSSLSMIALAEDEGDDDSDGTIEHLLGQSMSFEDEFSLHGTDLDLIDAEMQSEASKDIPSSDEQKTSPSLSPETYFPTSGEPTQSPSYFPTASDPTVSPTTSKPTVQPSMHPTTANPSHAPTSTSLTTMKPSSQPPTSKPSDVPSTMSPSTHPTTASPSHPPSTKSPSHKPTITPTSGKPTLDPSSAPTSSETTLGPSLSTLLTSTPSNELTREISISNELVNGPTAAPARSSITATPTSSKHVSLGPTMVSTTGSPVQFSTTNASITGFFSSQIRITINGVAVLMDNLTSSILENVTLLFLNEQFKGVLEVNEVVLLSQSFNQSSIDTAGRSRSVRVLNGRRFRTHPKTLSNSDEEMLLRSLSERSLLAVLSVDGMVSNRTALNEANNDDQVSGDSISTVLSQAISYNYEEFMIALANESNFFSSSSPQTTVSASAATESESTSESPNLKPIIVCGCVVAFVALVGSKFYLEQRKSKSKRRRLYHGDDREESAYDLNSVMKSGEDQIGDESLPGAENDMKEVGTYDGGCACLAPMDLMSPKKAKIHARMTSLLDQVCLLIMVNSTSSHTHPNILLFCCCSTFNRPIPPRLKRNKMKYLHWTCRRSASKLPSNVRRITFTCSPITKHLLRRRMESSQTII